MTHHGDEFSKSLAEESLPRRESLRRLGFLFAGAVLSPLGVGTAWARGADPCKNFCRCRNSSLQKECLAICNACNKDTSRLAGSCGRYTCCAAGQTSCGSYCADLGNDWYNCGSCGHGCYVTSNYESSACIDGQCEYWCVAGTVRCDGICTHLEYDPYNCGACGNVCDESMPYCVYGECNRCPDIGQVVCGNSCVNLLHDRFNCGACGNVCGPDTPDCVNGVCLDFCEPGLTFCPSGDTGYCADLMWDLNNCGQCYAFCAGICSGGECYPPPLPDETWGLVFE